MQTQLQSQFIKFDKNIEYIVKCTVCDDFFLSGKWKVRMGILDKNEKGLLEFHPISQGSRWGFRCVECPVGHTIAIYSNANPNKLIGDVLEIHKNNNVTVKFFYYWFTNNINKFNLLLHKHSNKYHILHS